MFILGIFCYIIILSKERYLMNRIAKRLKKISDGKMSFEEIKDEVSKAINKMERKNK
jgi:hypothetical protein